MSLAATVARRYRFGRFILDPDRRLLLADGAAVPLGSRAYDILVLLIERRHEVVSRDDILSHVWRGTTVEGNTLAVQISALRRALGETNVIATVPGRGYRFVGAVADEAAPEMDAHAVYAPMTLGRLQEDSVPPVGSRSPAPTPRWRRMLMFGTGLAVMVALLVSVGLRLRNASPPSAPRLSIVVLPFRNLGGDVQQDYLADAISDDLTTDLSHIPGSVVIARASADTYKGEAVATDVIGRTLNVRYLLVGSLRPERGTLHINAQLIDAPTGRHLWADAFDTAHDNLDTARLKIVQHIASALNVTLVDVEGARSLKEHATNPDALDFFLRARSVLDHSYSMTALDREQHLLEQAIALDPGYTEALARLGVVLLHKISDFDDTNQMRDYADAVSYINKVVVSGPENPSAISAKGSLELVDHRCEEAEASFNLALRLDPENMSARHGLAQCARMLGHMSEMVDVLQAILQAEPVGPQSAADQHLIGMGKLFLGKPEEALEWLDRAGASLTMSGDQLTTLGWREWREIYLIAATQLAGKTERARAYCIAYLKTRQNRTVWQLASYDTRAQAHMATYAAYLQALQSAGMPSYVAEDVDFHLSPTARPVNGGDFDATPLQVPGASTITTAQLRNLLAETIKPLIIDVGRGAAVIPGADWERSHDVLAGENQLVDQAIKNANARPDQSIVVMAGGPVGWNGYNATLHLISLGFTHVMWYRGGEQAWAAARLPSEDRRSP